MRHLLFGSQDDAAHGGLVISLDRSSFYHENTPLVLVFLHTSLHRSRTTRPGQARPGRGESCVLGCGGVFATPSSFNSGGVSPRILLSATQQRNNDAAPCGINPQTQTLRMTYSAPAAAASRRFAGELRVSPPVDGAPPQVIPVTASSTPRGVSSRASPFAKPLTRGRRDGRRVSSAATIGPSGLVQ